MNFYMKSLINVMMLTSMTSIVVACKSRVQKSSDVKDLAGVGSTVRNLNGTVTVTCIDGRIQTVSAIAWEAGVVCSSQALDVVVGSIYGVRNDTDSFGEPTKQKLKNNLMSLLTSNQYEVSCFRHDPIDIGHLYNPHATSTGEYYIYSSNLSPQLMKVEQRQMDPTSEHDLDLPREAFVITKVAQATKLLGAVLVKKIDVNQNFYKILGWIVAEGGNSNYWQSGEGSLGGGASNKVLVRPFGVFQRLRSSSQHPIEIKNGPPGCEL